MPFLLYGCETWSVIYMEEHRLRSIENRALRKYLGLRETRKQWNGENYLMRSFIICIIHQI